MATQTGRRRGPRALAPSIDKITRRLFGRRGFTEAAVLNDWPSVIGADLARQCLPEKITYPNKSKSRGTLHLRIANGAVALKIQHMEPILIERVNTFFGYQALARIRLVQAPLPPSDPAPRTKPKPATAPPHPFPEEVKVALEAIGDEDLRAHLESLGQAIAAGTRNGD